jgi:hypothetical protein
MPVFYSCRCGTRKEGIQAESIRNKGKPHGHHVHPVDAVCRSGREIIVPGDDYQDHYCPIADYKRTESTLRHVHFSTAS